MKTSAELVGHAPQRTPAAHAEARSQGGGIASRSWAPALDDSPRVVTQRQRLPGASGDTAQRWPTGNAASDMLIGIFLAGAIAWLIQQFFARRTVGAGRGTPGARPEAARETLPEARTLAQDIQPVVVTKIDADPALKEEVQQVLTSRPETSPEVPQAVPKELTQEPSPRPEEPVLGQSPVLAKIVDETLEAIEPGQQEPPVETQSNIDPASSESDAGSEVDAPKVPAAARRPQRGQGRGRKNARTEKLKQKIEETKEEESPPRAPSVPKARIHAVKALGLEADDVGAYGLSQWAGGNDAVWKAFVADAKAFDLGCQLAFSPTTLGEFLAWCGKEGGDYVDCADAYLRFSRQKAALEERKESTPKVEVRKNTLSVVERHWPNVAFWPGAGLVKGSLSVVTSKSGGGMVLLKGLGVAIGDASVPAHISLPPGAAKDGTFDEGHLKIEGGDLLNQYFFSVDGNGRVGKIGNSPTVPTDKPGDWSRLPPAVWTGVKALVEHLATHDY